MLRMNGLTLLKSGASAAVLIIALNAAAEAGTLPGHGRYVGGQGTIAKAGQVLTIDQNSRTGIINWKTFSVGKNNSVVFDNAHGATLNRVTGGNMSRIAGELHGTGSVYLINNSGVAVLPTGRIVTQGSFAASGGNADGDNFGTKKRLVFTGGEHGNVVNEGRIVAQAGRVDLYGRTVTDHGAIIAARGVETSGGRVNIAGARVDARSWLIDPKDLTVTSSAATSIEHTLNNGHNVTLKTTATGATGPGLKSNGPGNIIVAAGITWSGTAKLTLNTHHSVKIGKPVELKGKGSLAVAVHSGGVIDIPNGGMVTFDNLKAHFTFLGTAFTLVDTIKQLAAKIAAHPNGSFALAKDYNAKPLGTLHASAIPTAFGGNFEGFGHTISNLTIKDTHDAQDDGLFTALEPGGSIVSLRLSNVSVVGGVSSTIGGLVGNNTGSIFQVSVGGAVSGGNESDVGGITGANNSAISSSSSSATVKGGNSAFVGGLVGSSGGTISSSHASGAVTDNGYEPEVGGLVGASSGTVVRSSASGNVSATGYQSISGGLVGDSTNAITNSSASGDVSGGSDESAGGLAGYSAGTIAKSHASGAVSAGDEEVVGGLVGTSGAAISDSYASGAVNGGAASQVGGLVGGGASTIGNSHAVGKVTGGANSYVGGLIGYSNVSVTKSNAAGKVTGGVNSSVGGLIGYSNDAVTKSHAVGTVTGGASAYVGGLIGRNDNTLTSSYATGLVVDNGYEPVVGGLVGYNLGSITSSYATGGVISNADDTQVGGLVGYNNTTIAKSHATGNVSAAGLNALAGGLIGHNLNGTITLSYAAGDVLGGSAASGGQLGGFVGENFDAAISQSYALGSVTGGSDSSVGGFAGYSNGTLSEIYARGNATAGASGDVGGLIGHFGPYSTIDQAYSTGAVKGGSNADAGGLIGVHDNASSTITNAYWDRATSGITKASQGSGNIAGDAGITGRTTAQLKAALPAGFSTTYWAENSSKNNGFPYLKGIGGQ